MNLIAVLEGLLFVVGDEGISIEKLIRVLGISEEELQKIVDEYSKELNSNNRGLKLEKFNDNCKNIIITGKAGNYAVKKRTFVDKSSVKNIDGKVRIGRIKG